MSSATVTVMPLDDLRAGAERCLAEVGVRLCDLEAQGDVILFGSRAAGVAHADSDWDILTVGLGRKLKSPNLDVLFVSPDRVQQAHWLGSELGHHVGRFGLALSGSFAWKNETFCSDDSVMRKAARISHKIAALFPRLDRLSPLHQKKHSILLEQDLRRLWCLSSGLAVPPTANLLCACPGHAVAIIRELACRGVLAREIVPIAESLFI